MYIKILREHHILGVICLLLYKTFPTQEELGKDMKNLNLDLMTSMNKRSCDGNSQIAMDENLEKSEILR